ncbi:MAG: hypothetical protein OSJ66_08795 [Clostridia bacterium]|nr:hypothetical protein [Clostridia bacterium]
MSGKNFKSNKPLDTISQNKQTKASTELKQPEKPIKKKSNSDYLRLDVYGYKDYLSTMAGFRKMSITKYIQGLIDDDMEQNKEIYEKIKNI